jgi:hypothetical protein
LEVRETFAQIKESLSYKSVSVSAGENPSDAFVVKFPLGRCGFFPMIENRLTSNDVASAVAAHDFRRCEYPARDGSS